MVDMKFYSIFCSSTTQHTVKPISFHDVISQRICHYSTLIFFRFFLFLTFFYIVKMYDYFIKIIKFSILIRISSFRTRITCITNYLRIYHWFLHKGFRYFFFICPILFKRDILV